MDEDPRFPNRKKKQDWDNMSALGKPAEATPQTSDGEKTEAPELPLNIYHVVEAAPRTKEDEQREREELYSFREAFGNSVQTGAIPAQQIPSSYVEAPIYREPNSQTPQSQGLRERIRRFAASQTRVYAAIGVTLGVLIGVILAALTWFMGNPEGRYDLGSATSSAAGLKGHLFVEWDKKLSYRLAIEPDDPERQTAFALMVASSPHPLSVEIHLQNSEGFVLCSEEVLLRYDPKNAIELPSSNPDAQSGNGDADAAPGGQPAQGSDLSQTDAQQSAREKDKDVFKNQVGPNGQVTAINAQGTLPCTAKAYEKAVAWSFTSNFPAIAEQNALLERQQKLTGGGRSAIETANARKNAAAKAAQKLLPFSMEGDDSIVDFDASRGTIETSSGKVFFIDKAGGAVSDSRWQDYPVEVHYRCDRDSECTLTHAGTGSLHVRLRR